MSVFHLPRMHSDHCPVLLNLAFSSRIRRSTFRFQCAWYSHPDFNNWLSSTWSKGSEDICEKTKLFMGEAKTWSHEVFGDLNKRKRRLQARLKGIQRNYDQGKVNSLFKIERELKAELELVLKQEEFIWWQKSRSDWLCSVSVILNSTIVLSRLGVREGKLIGFCLMKMFGFSTRML